MLTVAAQLQYIMTAPGGLVVERSPGVREVTGSIPGQVIPKTLKMGLYASLPSTWHLKDRSRTHVNCLKKSLNRGLFDPVGRVTLNTDLFFLASCFVLYQCIKICI